MAENYCNHLNGARDHIKQAQAVCSLIVSDSNPSDETNGWAALLAEQELARVVVELDALENGPHEAARGAS